MTRQPSAVFSRCDVHKDCPDPYCFGRRYRYVLRWPTGVDNDRVALGIFANPSTATPDKLDPTLKRWANYCRKWGYGWSVTCNALAWRATDPKRVPCAAAAQGLHNLEYIKIQSRTAKLVLCGWGNLDKGEGVEVLQLLKSIGVTPHALKLTKSGRPSHPLYLRADLRPFPMGTL